MEEEEDSEKSIKQASSVCVHVCITHTWAMCAHTYIYAYLCVALSTMVTFSKHCYFLKLYGYILHCITKKFTNQSKQRQLNELNQNDALFKLGNH